MPFFFFQGLSFSNLEITLFFVKLSYVLEENHIFMKKVILSCLKKILKISQRYLKNKKLIFDIKQYLNWYNHPFDTCLNLLIMCKEGWCVGLGQEEVA